MFNNGLHFTLMPQSLAGIFGNAFRCTFFSGHGECDCGECKCHAGYIGDNCNCTTESSGCVSSDGQMCSGKGNCVCGQCQCFEPGAFGQTCEKCPTCPDACGTKRERGVYGMFIVKGLNQEDGPVFPLAALFGHSLSCHCAECATPPDAITVLLVVVGSILLIGLVFLAVWKLLVTIHDRHEFARFQSERSRARYEMVSVCGTSANNPAET
uniref:Integrin beta subunit cytoplasmic domain-containing protein n=1 Tax=Leptobrachium leishanense TaxID=445787 RepID=A0A8C5QVM8_9ANUR